MYYKFQNTKKAFTLVEILVVISIIATLASILLVALGSVQDSAKKTQTLSTMQAFGKAINAFQIDHGRLPEAIPNSCLCQDPNAVPPSDPTSSNTPWNLGITPLQNAMLELMGGYRTCSEYDVDSNNSIFTEFNSYISNLTDAFGAPIEYFPNDPISTPHFPKTSRCVVGYHFVVAPEKIGEGPNIDGKQYSPYLSLSEKELVYDPPTNFRERMGWDSSSVSPIIIPTIIDSWGNPIIYLPRERNSGPVIADSNNEDQSNRPQYDLRNFIQLSRTRYEDNLSIMWCEDVRKVIGLLIAHPSFTKQFDDCNGNEWSDTENYAGEARSDFILWSAGPDGIFLSLDNAPSDSDQTGDGFTCDEIDCLTGELDQFDDIIIYGG